MKVFNSPIGVNWVSLHGGGKVDYAFG